MGLQPEWSPPASDPKRREDQISELNKKKLVIINEYLNKWKRELEKDINDPILKNKDNHLAVFKRRIKEAESIPFPITHFVGERKPEKIATELAKKIARHSRDGKISDYDVLIFNDITQMLKRLKELKK